MPSRKVLLVGWDAADWKIIHPLMAAGKMPNVERLVNSGATGQIATLHPPLSPMLWTSICTGKRPYQHGIHGFVEPAPDGSGVRPVTNLSRKSKALWNILTQNGLRSTVIGWWPSHPAEPIAGVMVSDRYHRAGAPLQDGWPLPLHAVHPPELAERLAALRVHPDTLTPAMVEPFIPLAAEIDQDRDRRLGLFLRTLAECLTIQSAAEWLLDREPWDFFAVYFESIDHFCHGFMKYHPPRQPWIDEREFEIYRNVVAEAYQLHDRMLGTLMRQAGDGATVILMSDHGFHPDHLRPSWIPDIPAGPAVEHRDFGILAIGGPGIKSGEPLHGACVLDIAPTVLTLFGLPAGEDMDGKVLSQAFANPPQAAFIPSWEAVPGEDGRHPGYTRLDPVAAREALDQMIALGYIERPSENRELAIARTIRELRFNLGQAYQDGGRHREAYRIFTGLHQADPDEQRFAAQLFASCQALGYHHEMRHIVADLAGRRRELFDEAMAKVEALRRIAFERGSEAGGGGAPPESHLNEDERRELARWRNLARYQPPVVDYLQAQVWKTEKRYADALAALERVAEAHLLRPGMFLETAELYLRLRRPDDARRVLEQALAIDPDDAGARIGLSRLALRERNFELAAHWALDALERIYHDPAAHLLLGRALAGKGQYGRAADAFRAAISCNPNFPEAHIRLAALLERRLGDPAAAREHRRLARAMRGGEARPAVPPPASGASAYRRQQPAPLTAGGPGPLAESLIGSPAGDPVSAHEHRQPGRPAGPAPAPGDSALDRPRPVPLTTGGAAPLADSLIVVTGLPRSGTSLMMQMLAAGGIAILSDGVRQADEDNPRGYLEYEASKNLANDSQWLFEARGKAVKLVAPLLSALPTGLPCRVIFCERDLDEVLDSQDRMLMRRNSAPPATPERRHMLKDEYARTVDRMRAALLKRPATQVLAVEYTAAVSDPQGTAAGINRFLGGALDVVKMAAAVETKLYRNRAAERIRGPLQPRSPERRYGLHRAEGNVGGTAPGDPPEVGGAAQATADSSPVSRLGDG